jgi:hypothetical protein
VVPLTLAGDRLLPVAPALESFIPGGGLRRGSTVVVGCDRGRQGATSLAIALVSTASAAGSWCAVVGHPDFGVLAAAEGGMDLERVALVPRVGPAQWVTVVGALLDAVDLVIARPPARLRPGDARRLTTRARERGSVLVPLGGSAWVDGAELRLTVTGGAWEGPGQGDGRLLRHRVEVTVDGRGAAARGRQVELWFPLSLSGSYAGADAHLIPDPIPDPVVPAVRDLAG